MALLTPSQFAIAIDTILQSSSKDREKAHVDADALLAGQLRELGYGAGIEIYEQLTKWCA